MELVERWGAQASVRYVDTLRGTVAVRHPENRDYDHVAVTSVRGGQTWMMLPGFGSRADSRYLYSPGGLVLEHGEAGLRKVEAPAGDLFCAAVGARYSGAAVAYTYKAVYLVAEHKVMRWDLERHELKEFRPELAHGSWSVASSGELLWHSRCPGPRDGTYHRLCADDATWVPYGVDTLPYRHCVFFSGDTLVRLAAEFTLVQCRPPYYLRAKMDTVQLFHVDAKGSFAEYVAASGQPLALDDLHYMEDTPLVGVMLCSSGGGGAPPRKLKRPADAHKRDDEAHKRDDEAHKCDDEAVIDTAKRARDGE